MTIASHLRRQLRVLQQRIEALYGLEPGPDVRPFVEVDAECERETVLVGQGTEGALELLVVFPEGLPAEPSTLSDERLQLIEGVSHFVHLSERARTELPTTQLELELQAEVDKFALLAPEHAPAQHDELHRWLFERVTFLHPESSTTGQRYRLANDLAAKLWARLVQRRDESFTRELLYRFYRLGQAGKLSLIAAV